MTITPENASTPATPKHDRSFESNRKAVDARRSTSFADGVRRGRRFESCPRYQRKWPPETAPRAIFMPVGHGFGNIS